MANSNVISINLDVDLIVEVDEIGRQEERNRSNMIQVLLREAIAMRKRIAGGE